MNILATIVKFLNDAGPRRWPAIERETGVAVGTLRKLAYRDLKNPTLRIVQPILDYLDLVKRRKRPYPSPDPVAAREPATPTPGA